MKRKITLKRQRQRLKQTLPKQATKKPQGYLANPLQKQNKKGILPVEITHTQIVHDRESSENNINSTLKSPTTWSPLKII